MPWHHDTHSIDLHPLIGRPACPVLLDVTIDEDVALDPFLIPSAVRVPHDQITTFAQTQGITSAVVICQKGKKLSQGAAAALRATGLAASYLEGGNVGWAAFAPELRVKAEAAPTVQRPGTVWVLPEAASLDDLAQAWLILRFVNPRTTFWMIDASQVSDVAVRFGAQTSETTSFSDALHVLGLQDKSLATFATALAGTDILHTLINGLERQHTNTDEFLSAAWSVFDGLYGNVRHMTARIDIAPGETAA